MKNCVIAMSLLLASSSSTCWAWSKQFGDSSHQESRSVATYDDAIYVGGSFNGDLDFGAGVLHAIGGTDAFLAKLDATGAAEWSWGFGDQADQQINVVAANDTRLAVAAQFFGSIDFGLGAHTAVPGGSAIAVAVLDSDGIPVWSQAIKHGQPYGLAIDANNNTFVSGIVFGEANFGCGVHVLANNGDAFVAAFDSAGSCLWSKVYPGQFNQWATALALSASGELYVGGQFQSSMKVGAITLSAVGTADGFVMKLDPVKGSPLWVKQVSPGAGGSAFVSALDVTAAGDKVVVTGGTTGQLKIDKLQKWAGVADAFAARLSAATGNPGWITVWGDSAGIQTSQSIVAHDAYAIAGGDCTGSLAPLAAVCNGNADAFLVKLSLANGALVKGSTYGNAKFQTVRDVAVSRDQIVGFGDFNGTIDFGFGPHSVAGGGLPSDLILTRMNY